MSPASTVIVAKQSLWAQLGLDDASKRREYARAHVDRLKAHFPDKLERIHRAHQEHAKCLSTLRQCLADHGVHADLIERKREENQSRSINRPELRTLISVGGDGTLLTTGQWIQRPEVTCVGVRSSSLSVGKLCAFDGLCEQSLQQLARSIAQHCLETYQAARFASCIERYADGKRVFSRPVLNDALYSPANPAVTARYQLSLARTDAQPEDSVAHEHKSSGIWIATATGSSAAISAAGGQIVEGTRTDFQFRVRELFQDSVPDDQLSAGFFSPPDQPCFSTETATPRHQNDVLKIRNWNEHAILAADGHHQALSLNFGDLLTFYRTTPLSLAKSSEN